MLLAEARGILEFNASLLLSPLLLRAPRGDGHPVLTLPGFLASDLSMLPMRRYLNELGYLSHAWKMGRNIGGVSRMRAALRDRLGEIHAATGRKVLANSRGCAGGYRTSYASVSAAPLAVDEHGQMQRDGWWSAGRSFAHLESPEAVGKEAARRTLRRLGARKVPTQRVPIVFAPEVARTLIGSVFEAASGDAIWRSASFLAGKLGAQIAAPTLNLIDDNTMLLPSGAGGFGTSPFDGEGLPSRRTVVVEKGILQSYLLNTYTARKLGMKSTHNASRGLAGTPGIGCGNLYLEPGALTPEQIIGDVAAGLYVTSLMGFGVNVVTGDYSRGATGLWIENGQLTHAVEEVTIAGNLAEMLQYVTSIGNDLVFRGAVASPTLRIDGMTIAGA